jgi:hypothetical protein
MNNSEQQTYNENHYSSITNNHQENSHRYSNKHHTYNNNNNINGRNYPKSAPPNHQAFRCESQNSSREFHKSTYHPVEQKTNNNSHRSYQQNNSPRACFICGSANHIKAQCPSLKKKDSIGQEKFSK